MRLGPAESCAGQVAECELRDVLAGDHHALVPFQDATLTRQPKSTTTCSGRMVAGLTNTVCGLHELKFTVITQPV